MKLIFDEDAERAVLGALLLDNDVIEIVDRHIGPEDFYIGKYKTIFSIINDLIKTGDHADIKTVGAKYSGSVVDVATLTDIPTAANCEYFCKRVKDLSIRRKIKVLLQGLASTVDSPGQDIAEFVEHMETELTDIMDSKAWNYERIDSLLLPTIKEIEVLYNNGGMIGIASGYPEIDKFTGGFVDGELIVIGARASIGKTALTLNMAENIAKRGTAVGFLSLEMANKQLTQRLLVGNSGVGLKQIRSGMLREEDFARLNAAAELLYTYPLYLYDYPNARLMDIKLKARRMVRKEGIKILFVDYLGLIKTEAKVQRWEEVGIITSELKALSRELNIPVVVCAQVNRDAEGKAPTLANLRESGNIEQDADVVFFLHRQRDSANSELFISKNRNGGTGKIDLYYVMERTRFEEVAKSA